MTEITHSHSHKVQFYESENYLFSAIDSFFADADGSVIIAEPSHINKVEDSLYNKGFDVRQLKKDNRFIALNAHEVLEKFMVNGMPDEEKFIKMINPVLEKVSFGRKNPKAFGEMVSILVENNNEKAAVLLEDLWNNILSAHKIDLLCAYKIHSFDDDKYAASFHKICTQHSHVFPSESFTELDTSDKQLRRIAELQQHAISLKAEIKKRKEAEDALKNSERRYRRQFEAANDAVIIVDFDSFLVLDANPQAEELLGEIKSSLISKKIYNLSLFSKELINDIFKRLNNENVIRFDELAFSLIGLLNKHFEVIFNLYTEGTSNIVQCILRDITTRKILEQQKDDFINAASHELKTPLTSQKAYIQLLQKSLIESGKLEHLKYLGKISDQTEKLSKLVKDLLDGTKMQAGNLTLKYERFDLNKVVEDIVEDIEQADNFHILSINGKISKPILADKERITQVLSNIIENAVKYSPQDPKVTIRLYEKENEVLVSIKDKGIGISAKDQPFIFDRFFRSNSINEKTFPGMGIGLFICSQIIKQHKGRLWVNSEKNKGSEFSFSIPLL